MQTNKMKCKFCGCTDEKACPEGCYRVGKNKCSSCFPGREINFSEEIALCVGEQFGDLAKSALCFGQWKNKDIDLKQKVRDYEMLLTVLNNATKLIKELQGNAN